MYMHHTPPLRLYSIFTNDLHVSYTSVKALQRMYMYHTPPSRLYFIFTDDIHASYTSVKALFQLYWRYTCIINPREGLIPTLQVIYMQHTTPSRLYFNFTDDVHASYNSVKVLFQLLRRLTCIIHLRQCFILSLQTMYIYHTHPSRLYFYL